MNRRWIPHEILAISSLPEGVYLVYHLRRGSWSGRFRLIHSGALAATLPSLQLSAGDSASLCLFCRYQPVDWPSEVFWLYSLSWCNSISYFIYSTLYLFIYLSFTQLPIFSREVPFMDTSWSSFNLFGYTVEFSPFVPCYLLQVTHFFSLRKKSKIKTYRKKRKRREKKDEDTERVIWKMYKCACICKVYIVSLLFIS